MKRWGIFWVVAVLAMLVLLPMAAGAESVSVVIDADATGGTWTPGIEVGKSSFMGDDSTRSLGIFISGTWAGTVGLQYSLDGGAWTDLYINGVRKTWTSNTHDTLTDYAPGIRYRIGMAQGAFVSGACTVLLNK